MPKCDFNKAALLRTPLEGCFCISQQTYQLEVGIDTTLTVNFDRRSFNFDIWLKIKVY